MYRYSSIIRNAVILQTMKGKYHRLIRRLITWILLIVMSLLMANRVFYTHIHIMKDGSMVSHAHPFPGSRGDTGVNDHQHSSLEFFLLDQLEVLTICAFALYVLKAFTRSLPFIHLYNDQPMPSLVPILPGRAPPVCM